jgi:ribosomal protein S18 acetylase RimI-like enzyme
MEIRPATAADVDRLIASFAEHPGSQHHVRGRWDTQRNGDGLYLIAHRDEEIVGQTMILRASKYAEVRAAQDPAEINGLHAYVQNQGVGTALIRACEQVATEWTRAAIGLGVGHDNPNARRLYEHLGYQLWSGPPVTDTWTEQDATGTVVRTHNDLCDYLVKAL